MSVPAQVWVADSSSLILVRETVSRANEQIIWTAFSKLAATDELVWPPEVTQEIEWGARQDTVMNWVRSHKNGCERTAGLETVKSVLSVAQTLIDPDSPREQADPYVIALARDLLDVGGLFQPRVTIITDDLRDKPTKMSLSSAAGLMSVPTVPLRAFLISRGLI